MSESRISKAQLAEAQDSKIEAAAAAAAVAAAAVAVAVAAAVVVEAIFEPARSLSRLHEKMERRSSQAQSLLCSKCQGRRRKAKESRMQ